MGDFRERRKIMDYWKETIAGLAGVIVMWRLVSMHRTFLTKDSHEKMCKDKMDLVQSQIKVAVLEAMNSWLKQNGHHLRK